MPPIDWTTLPDYIGWIAAQRPTAIAMNMDASEGPSLDHDEQLEVLRVCREAIGDACPLVSGLISGSTRDAVRWGMELRAQVRRDSRSFRRSRRSSAIRCRPK